MKGDVRNQDNYWVKVKTDIFWRDIAFRDHVFYVYESEDKFLDVLAGFVGTGINANDCTIVIATPLHLEKLKQKLISYGLHFDSLLNEGQYLPISAEKALNKFMVEGLPDEELFNECISGIIEKAKPGDRKTRVFREMGSLLSLQGNIEATTYLEVLWSKFIPEKSPSFFCAYPQKTFLYDDCESIKKIGFKHSKLITNASNLSEILYKSCLENVS